MEDWRLSRGRFKQKDGGINKDIKMEEVAKGYKYGGSSKDTYKVGGISEDVDVWKPQEGSKGAALGMSNGYPFPAGNARWTVAWTRGLGSTLHPSIMR